MASKEAHKRDDDTESGEILTVTPPEPSVTPAAAAGTVEPSTAVAATSDVKEEPKRKRGRPKKSGHAENGEEKGKEKKDEQHPGHRTYRHHKSFVEKAMGAKKRYNKRTNSAPFASYIYKVLRQLHPDVGISKSAMSVMESFVHDMFTRLCMESSNLTKMAHRRTLGSREIQGATKLVLPLDLSKHAISEGNKAIIRYTSAVEDAESGRAKAKAEKLFKM